jgi:hypothetical protein
MALKGAMLSLMCVDVNEVESNQAQEMTRRLLSRTNLKDTDWVWGMRQKRCAVVER